MLPTQLLTPLAIYALLTAALVGIVFMYRTSLVLLRRSPANVWPRSHPATEPTIVQRAHDAHKNCVETFPLLLVALLALANNSEALLSWGWCVSWLVGLRLIQSAIHVIGTQPALVFTRGLFFAGQMLGLTLL
ncbi:MAG: MAPEG family protein, partial [Oceanococcaceae bacterium]